MSEAKLYPPQLNDTLPAVIKGQQLLVPFQLNRAVSRNDFNRMSIILKTVQTNTTLCNGEKEYDAQSISFDGDKGYYIASFPNSVSGKMQIGQYYKIQVAFTNLNTSNSRIVGYYSTSAIIKCTSQPAIGIDGLSMSQTINAHRYSYTGTYSQDDSTQDKTEKVYTYRFDLRDESDKLVVTSGDLIHNSSTDTERYSSSDTWNVTKDLQPGYWYTLQYTVTTLNNLTVSSPAYKIMTIENVDYEFPADLVAQMHQVDGYVDLKLVSHEDANAVRGSFILIRSSEEDNYNTWQQLYKFDIVNKIPNINLWQDFTVQQGMHYKYAIQAYNSNGLYSSKIMNVGGPVFADFEDAFLFDGERQLNIRYNPKVSSFKTTILESKMDTLGGKHPFIFRNGNVRYQEFPISGLISMLSDPNNLFTQGLGWQGNEPVRERTKTSLQSAELNTQLLGDNFRKERQFKMEVLNWLNDGRPKLFRSPGEGNFIVRLMNVSLSPNDTLGRMLHTFSCTAYEIADYNFENLNKYGFVQAPLETPSQLQIDQRSLKELFGNTATPTENTEYTFIDGAVWMLSISNQQYDSLVLKFFYQDGTNTDEINVCNPTGQMNIFIDKSPITKIQFISGTISEESRITYGFIATNITNNFSQITNITVEDKIAQYVGGSYENNLIEELEDIRLQTGRFYYIKAIARNVQSIYKGENGQYYKDEECKYPIETWDATCIYQVLKTTKYLYGSPSDERETAPDYRLSINSRDYSDLAPSSHGGVYKTQGDFKTLANVDRVETLKFGSGIILNIVYQLKTLHYGVEETNDMVKTTKDLWKQAEEEYLEAVENNENIQSKKLKCEQRYNEYIGALTSALDAEREVV